MNKAISIENAKSTSEIVPELDFLLTVKSFNLQEIQKRYINSRKNKSGRAGSVSRRIPSEGGIVSVRIKDGVVHHSEVIKRMKEPRGIDSKDDGSLAIAAENIIYIFEGSNTYKLENPWFSYIHTVKFSPFHRDRVLIASSGLDRIMEMDYKTGETTFDWLAWENGFNEGYDNSLNKPIYLTNSGKQADIWAEKNIHHKLIDDPQSQVLPTAMRAAFINSIAYDLSEGSILATFFHEGCVFRIDRNTGKAENVLSGLKNPHGGVNFNGGILATSTASGEVIWKKNDSRVSFDFNNLPGKDPGLEGLEWLQNTATINDLMITIDSNRTRFSIYNLEGDKVCHIPYDVNWAVQDIVICEKTPDGLEKLRDL